MDQIAAFDTLFTNNHIQICKLLLPSLPKDKQYLFAILIKFWELDYVVRHGKKLVCPSSDSQSGSPDYQKLCNDILPYCDENETKMVQSILQILKTLDTVKTLAPLMELMKQMQTTTDAAENPSGGSMPDLGSILSMSGLFGDSDSSDLMGLFDSFLHTSKQNTSDSGVENIS